jgi:hypothetical protein
MTMRCAVLLAWCLSVRAAERSPDEVIKRVTERVVASVARIPSYTCVETIVREYYQPAAATLPRACPVLMEQRQHPTPDLASRLAMTDRLRLDVTMTARGEIFSWVGASRFDDRSIFQMVGGRIATGAFGAFLSIIFKHDVHKFTFERSTEVEGRRLMEYSFRVAAENSSYALEISGSSVSVKTGYSGTVLADPVTGDVVRLTVKATEMPTATTACEISTNLALQMVKIGDSEFLLPAQARQRYVLTTGEETENTTTFAGCREYLGESSVSFNAPKSAADGFRPSAPATLVRVPAEQRFTVELTAPIASLTAAAGDAFSGRLLTPLRDERRRTLARTGSLVEGRILRVERHHVAPAFTVVALKLERVEIGGSMVPLAAVRDWSRELHRGTGKAHVEIPLPLPSEKNAAVFRFAGDEAVVPRGDRSDWRTVDTEQQDHDRRQGH